jgi:L-aminopeptidase/D-esterase-like protein
MAERRNLLTDVAGVRVGHATDRKIGSGVTTILFDEPFVAAGDLRGGGTGTREAALLEPAATVERIDAVVFSGGSAFGLDAASGAMAWLVEQGRGFAVATARVPIVPAAILFDLLAPGDKNWGRYPPYRELGYEAAAAAGHEFALGSVGAGTGATTENLKGGLGSASAESPTGHRVGALVAVNAAGRATIGDGPHFWAAPYERDREFGGLGVPAPMPAEALVPHLKGAVRASTTLGIVVVDAVLTKPQAKRLAIMAQDGLSRSLDPIHTPLDGDLVIAAATGRRPLTDPVRDLASLGAVAAHCLSRAVGRGVFEATAVRGGVPAWRDRFGSR